MIKRDQLKRYSIMIGRMRLVEVTLGRINLAQISSAQIRSAIGGLGLIFLLLVMSVPARGEHPIDVQRANANGQHIDALARYSRIPKKKLNGDAAFAAGKSAWALSLSDKAQEELARAAEYSQKDPEKLTQINFLRAIVDFQDARFQESLVRAQSAIDTVADGSALKARILLLMGQTYLILHKDSHAEQRMSEALKYADPTDRAELYFARGEARFQLGKFDEAREDFEKISLKSERLPEAIRYLARIGMELKRYKEAQFWLHKGRREFPEAFLDSWVDYAMGTSAIKSGDSKTARDVVKRAREQYPPSDPWFTLLEAQAEEFEWRASMGEAL